MMKKIFKNNLIILISLILLFCVVIPVGIKVSDKMAEISLTYRIHNAKYGTFISLGNEVKVKAKDPYEIKGLLLPNDKVFITDGTHVELFNYENGKYKPIIPSPKFNWVNNSIFSYFNYFIPVKYNVSDGFTLFKLKDGRLLLYRDHGKLDSLIFNPVSNSFKYTKLPKNWIIKKDEKFDERLLKIVGLPKEDIYKAFGRGFLMNYIFINSNNVLIADLQAPDIVRILNKSDENPDGRMKLIIKKYNINQDKITELYEYTFEENHYELFSQMYPNIYKINNYEFIIFAGNRIFEYNSNKKTFIQKTKILKNRAGKSTRLKNKLIIYGGKSKEIEEYDIDLNKIKILGRLNSSGDLYCSIGRPNFMPCRYGNNYTRDIVIGNKIIFIKNNGRSELFDIDKGQSFDIGVLNNSPQKTCYQVIATRGNILVTGGITNTIYSNKHTELLILNKGAK